MTITLTQAEVNHLVYLINDNDREGWYYGNRKQWEDRSARLLQKLSPPTPSE